jgi:hypothetical protein
VGVRVDVARARSSAPHRPSSTGSGPRSREAQPRRRVRRVAHVRPPAPSPPLPNRCP